MSKIRWQCRRGMLELDLLLLDFVEKKYEKLNEIEKQQFESLLTHSDQDLYQWLTGMSNPDSLELQSIVEKVRVDTCRA